MTYTLEYVFVGDVPERTVISLMIISKYLFFWLSHVLISLLQAVLVHKPDDVFGFASDYFGTFTSA
jgi:hypothetical protein